MGKADRSQLVHADLKFDPNSSPQCYRSNDEVIQKDTKVRLQIVGCRMEANDIVSSSAVPGDLRSAYRSLPSVPSRRTSWGRSRKTRPLVGQLGDQPIVQVVRVERSKRFRFLCLSLSRHQSFYVSIRTIPSTCQYKVSGSRGRYCIISYAYVSWSSIHPSIILECWSVGGG